MQVIQTNSSSSMFGQLLGMLLGRNLADKQEEKAAAKRAEAFQKMGEYLTTKEGDIRSEKQKALNQVDQNYYGPAAQNGRVEIDTALKPATTEPSAVSNLLPPKPNVAVTVPKIGAGDTMGAAGFSLNDVIQAAMGEREDPETIAADQKLGVTNAPEKVYIPGVATKQTVEMPTKYLTGHMSWGADKIAEQLKPMAKMGTKEALAAAAIGSKLGLSPEASLKIGQALTSDYNDRISSDRKQELVAAFAKSLKAADTPTKQNEVMRQYAPYLGDKFSEILDAIKPGTVGMMTDKEREDVITGRINAKSTAQNADSNTKNARTNEIKTAAEVKKMMTILPWDVEEIKSKIYKNYHPNALTLDEKDTAKINTDFNKTLAEAKVEVDKQIAKWSVPGAKITAIDEYDPVAVKLRHIAELAENGGLPQETKDIMWQAHYKLAKLLQATAHAKAPGQFEDSYK